LRQWAALTLALGLVIGPCLISTSAGGLALDAQRPISTPLGIACSFPPHLSALAVDEHTDRVYAYSSPVENGLAVFNASTDSEEAFVRTNLSPDAIAVDSAAGRVFVALNPGFGPGEIEVLNDSTSTEVAEIPLTFGPDAVVYDGSNGNLYVGGETVAYVSVIDGSTLAAVTNISLPNSNFPYGPLAMTLGPENDRLYLAGGGTPFNITVLDAQRNSVAGVIPVPGTTDQFASIAVNPSGSLLFVAEPGLGNVTVINSTTGGVEANISLGLSADPQNMMADESSATLYVTDIDSGYVSVINMTTLHLETSVRLAASPESLAVDSTLQELFVATEGANAVAVIDTRSNLVLDTISPPSTYPVEFSESGLPGDVDWTVSLSFGSCGALDQSQASYFTFDLPNGTYRYTSTNVSDFTRTDGTGYIDVRGEPLFISIGYSPPPPTFLGYPVLEGQVILGCLIGASAAVAIEAAYFAGFKPWRRR